ncbi:MAG: hypothetical protein H7251_07905 [Acetobacteraceae bacterium]|nr:hypothetical protein [Acetobacteraceae bacterium]
MARFRRFGLIGLIVLAGCATPQEGQPIIAAARGIAKQAEQSGDYTVGADVLTGLRSQGHGNPEISRDEVRLLLLAGRQAEAETLLRSLMAAAPRPDIARQLANIRLAAGNAAEALAIVDAANDKSDALLLNTGGASLDALGRHAEAQARYRAALRIRPDDATIVANLALSLLLIDQPRSAMEEITRIGQPAMIAQGKVWELALVLAAVGRTPDAAQALNLAGRGPTARDDLAQIARILALSPDQRRAALIAR